MLNLISTDAEYLQNVVFNFEKGSLVKITPGFPPPDKKISSAKFLIPQLGEILPIP